MQASSLPDEQTLVRLVVAKRQSTVARFSQDRTCLTAQGLLTGAWRIVAYTEVGLGSAISECDESVGLSLLFPQ